MCYTALSPFVLVHDSFAAAVITVVVYYLVFNGKNMFKDPLEADDIFVFGEFQESVGGRFICLCLSKVKRIQKIGEGCSRTRSATCNSRGVRDRGQVMLTGRCATDEATGLLPTRTFFGSIIIPMPVSDVRRDW